MSEGLIERVAAAIAEASHDYSYEHTGKLPSQAILSAIAAVRIMQAENERILAGSRDNKLHFDVLKADYDALIAAGDKLAGFAGHDRSCMTKQTGSIYTCTCGYTEAWKAWAEARGDD